MQAISRLLRLVVISLSVIVCATTVFGSRGGNELLTPAEQLWLEENRSRIVLAVETAYPPFVFLDSNKQPSGLAHDYLLLLQSKLGVQFKQKQFSSLESIFAEVRAGEVQIVNAVTKTPERSEFLLFTEPFISVPNVILVRGDQARQMVEKDLAGLKVSLVKSYAITEHLSKLQPGLKIDLVSDDLSALLNVSSGHSDAAVVDLATASYLISSKGITGLRVAGEASFGIHLSLAVPNSEPELYGILQKSLQSITKEEGLEIHSRWIHLHEKDILTAREILIGTAILLLVVLGIVAATLVWRRTLQRQIALRTAELVREKEALRLREEHHRTLLQTAMSGILLLDSEGRLLEINSSYCTMSGYSEAELLAMNIADLEAMETAADVAARIEKIMKRGGDRFESRHRRKDGSIYDVEVSVQCRPAEGGQFVVFLHDISERKRADKQVRLQANIIDNSPVIAAYHDSDLNVVWVNRAYQEATGLSLEEVRGRKCYQVWNLSEPCRGCPVITAIETGENAAAELTPDNQNHWPETQGYWFSQASPVWDEHGTVIGALEFAIDITERKHAEDEKLKLESQLQQAQKVEAVGRLAGGVAHDFNNMLSVILGHTEMALMRMDQNQPLYSSIAEIRKAAQRSADLTRQLLAFARKQTITPKAINLNETVAGMLTMLQRLIGENTQLTWQPATNLWPVMMDCSQVDQIMANLCVNARDAIADVGRIIIETGNCSIDEYYCTIHPYASPGEYVKVTVGDDGKGMDPETLEHIFEPFFTTKGVGEGTGLGLATVYGIVRQNNGFINVYSEPGTGTTFTIYLPRYQGETGEAPQEGAAEPSRRGHETILLVEDEAQILEMTALILTELGYRVLKANSPGEALQLARDYSGEIDLLITDVIMPEMNGRDLANNLRSSYPQMQRLFMSGYTADIIAHHGVLGAGVHFIQKPFQLNVLAAKLREVLDGV
jgi:PAS domain S-box-containing protein